MAAHSARVHILGVEIFHITYSGFVSLFHAFLFFMLHTFFGICCKRINTSCHVLNTCAKICYTKVLNIDITVNANAENDVMPANKTVILVIDFINLKHFKSSIKIKCCRRRKQTKTDIMFETII